MGKELGKGAYAVVKLAVHKASNRKFAVKVYEKYRLLDPIRKNSVKREIEILKKIDHVSIVKLHEVIDTPKQVKLLSYSLDSPCNGTCSWHISIVAPQSKK